MFVDEYQVDYISLCLIACPLLILDRTEIISSLLCNNFKNRKLVYNNFNNVYSCNRTENISGLALKNNDVFFNLKTVVVFVVYFQMF